MLIHGHTLAQPPPRVVVLGSGGFVGARLTAKLRSDGVPVEAIGSRQIDLTAEGAHVLLENVFLPTDTVVFAAAVTSDQRRDYGAFMLNVRMAEQVCLAVQKQPCAHFIYLSSDAVYDAHQVPLDEDSTREPLNLYALTHTAREMMLHDTVDPLDIPFCVLRPTSIYGPGDTHGNYGPNRFIPSALNEGKIVLFGQGEERRSHVFIDDAIQLITLCIRHRSRGTLNLAVKPALAYLAVAQMVKAASPRPVAFEFRPRQVPSVHRPYKSTQVFRFLYNLGRPIGPIVHRPYAINAITKAFPDFSFTSPEEGIRRFIAAAAVAPATNILVRP